MNNWTTLKWKSVNVCWWLVLQYKPMASQPPMVTSGWWAPNHSPRPSSSRRRSRLRPRATHQAPCPSTLTAPRWPPPHRAMAEGSAHMLARAAPSSIVVSVKYFSFFFTKTFTFLYNACTKVDIFIPEYFVSSRIIAVIHCVLYLICLLPKFFKDTETLHVWYWLYIC